jgi:hypothetical protein
MKGQEDNSQGTNKPFVHVAKLLYGLGFNVIPVDGNKRPIIDSWSSDSRLPWGELERCLSKAEGLAITGRYFNSEDYYVVILDLDDVDVAFEVLGKVFGEQWQARLCGQTWSFCGLTGPRPKGKVKCGCETPDQDCECVNTETGERRKLSELQRGMYIVVRVPKRCLPGGSVRSDAVEVMVSNYEVVYGRHPSGVYYQPVRFVNGRWTPIGIEDVGQGEVINCDELKALITLLKQSPVYTLEELGGEDAKTVAELNLPEPIKELSEDAINRIVDLVRPIWWLEINGKHVHDLILFGLSCLMRRAGISHESAKRVIEAIINTSIQDIVGKVDPITLQRLERDEQRHFRETVDYVYSKPTAKLWGKKTFEQNLSPALERAISQGLLSDFTKPKDWFTAVYKALGLRRGGLLKRIIEERLPKTRIDVSKLPKWIWKFELKLDKCEDWYLDMVENEDGVVVGRESRCARRVRAVTREDSQYVLIVEVVHRRERKKHLGGGYEIHRKAIYRHIATLPRFMGVVYDPFYKDNGFYAAFKDGKLYSVASVNDFDSFIKDLMKPPFSAPRNKQYLELINESLPEVRMVISPGIAEDEFVDPYGVLDLGDYGVDPLLRAYEWVRRYYPEANARWAWFNVMASMAKTLTPLIRYHNRTFNDLIVYNVGRGGEGKSTLVRYILLPLLGGDDARESYNIVMDGPVKTDAQLRNLLSLNRLPLILDEQNRKALASNVGIFLSAVVGMGTIGIHASKYGLGVATKFKNLRGMIVFTNVPFMVFLRDIMSEASDYAIIRRFIEVPWDSEPISQTAFKDPPELRPIYGFVTRLWMKYKSELVKSADLLELIEKLATAIGREYPADSRVDEMVQYTLDVVKELREEKRNERLALTDADALVNRAYEFVANELKGTQLTAVRVLRYILENPQRAGIKLAMPRKREDIDKLKGELDSVIRSLSAVNKDPDADALYQLLDNAYNEGKVLVILYARSPLIPGVPKEFLGVPKNVYAEGGAKKFGYAVPLAQLVRVFLTGWEEEEDSETTGKTNANGEHS